MRKYGPENFVFDILAYCSSIEEMNNLEKLWIITLRTYDNHVGYNLTFGGEGFGILTEQGRKNLIEAITGLEKHFTDEYKLVLAQRGREANIPRKGRSHIQQFGEERAASIAKRNGDSHRVPHLRSRRTHQRLCYGCFKPFNSSNDLSQVFCSQSCSQKNAWISRKIAA